MYAPVPSYSAYPQHMSPSYPAYGGVGGGPDLYFGARLGGAQPGHQVGYPASTSDPMAGRFKCAEAMTEEGAPLSDVECGRLSLLERRAGCMDLLLRSLHPLLTAWGVSPQEWDVCYTKCLIVSTDLQRCSSPLLTRLIVELLRQGDDEGKTRAWHFFERLCQIEKADVYQYSVMLNACIDSESADKLIERMERSGIKPSEVTYQKLYKIYLRDARVDAAGTAVSSTPPDCF